MQLNQNFWKQEKENEKENTGGSDGLGGVDTLCSSCFDILLIHSPPQNKPLDIIKFSVLCFVEFLRFN